MDLDTKVYGSFSLLKNDKIIWSLDSSFTDDLISGMILALITLNISKDTNFEVIEPFKNLKINLADRESLNKILEPHIIVSNKSLSEFELYNPDPGNYGLWVISPEYSINTQDKYYSLYQFKTTSFIQGFISICNNFSTDFRDYIYDLPFRYVFDSNTLIKYNIEGYD